MKQIHNLYKLLILFCATFLAQNAVAQEVGDKYKTSGEILIGYRVTVADDNNENLQKAFDGDRDNTWWNASSAGPRTITVSLDNNTTLSSITLIVSEVSFEITCWDKLYSNSFITVPFSSVNINHT